MEWLMYSPNIIPLKIFEMPLAILCVHISYSQLLSQSCKLLCRRVGDYLKLLVDWSPYWKHGHTFKNFVCRWSMLIYSINLLIGDTCKNACWGRCCTSVWVKTVQDYFNSCEKTCLLMLIIWKKILHFKAEFDLYESHLLIFRFCL